MIQDNRNNIDTAEIKKFDAIASNWWDLEGEFKPLHRINPLRLDYISTRCGHLSGKKILDVGCGGGILSEAMAKAGANVTGLDMAEEALSIARKHAASQQLIINYVQQTVEAHAKEHAGEYDVITCMELLEHVPDPASIIQACAKLVKPQGDLFFSTINRNTKAWLMLIVGAEYVARMVPKGTHDAKKFIRPSELIQWLESSQIQTQHAVGLKYHLVGNYFSLSDNLDTNYMLHAHNGAK